MLEDNIYENVGTILKNSRELNKMETDIMFHPHEKTYFRKMVSESVINTGVYIRPLDYLKGLSIISYFTEVYTGSIDCAESLIKVSKAILKDERNNDKESMRHYLNLEIILMQLGIKAKDIFRDGIDKRAVKNKQWERYSNLNGQKDGEGMTTADPYYNVMGHVVVDMISNENNDSIKNVNDRREILALITADSIYNIIENNAHRSEIQSHLADNKFFESSRIALKHLMEYAVPKKLIAAIKNNEYR